MFLLKIFKGKVIRWNPNVSATRFLNFECAESITMDTGLFDIDPDFCCYCGTFLRMNIRKGLLTCDSCDSSFNVLSDKFCDQHQTIIFDEDETAVVAKKKSGVDVIADRVCQKCGNPQMSFKTLQTRSADEGQTVYYTCLKCEYTDVEFA